MSTLAGEPVKLDQLGRVELEVRDRRNHDVAAVMVVVIVVGGGDVTR